MRISEIAKRLDLEQLGTLHDKEIEGVYISDMVSDIVAGAPANSLLVTIQTHKNLIATANLVDVGAIVYVRGKRPMEDVIQLAERAKLSLFVTPMDAWRLAVKLNELGLR